MKEEVAEEKRQFLLQLEEERAHLMEETPRAENAKINVTDEPYFGNYILCSSLFQRRIRWSSTARDP